MRFYFFSRSTFLGHYHSSQMFFGTFSAWSAGLHHSSLLFSFSFWTPFLFQFYFLPSIPFPFFSKTSPSNLNSLVGLHEFVLDAEYGMPVQQLRLNIMSSCSCSSTLTCSDQSWRRTFAEQWMNLMADSSACAQSACGRQRGPRLHCHLVGPDCG